MPWDTDDSSGLLHRFIGKVDSSIWTTDSKKQDPNSAFLTWDVDVVDVTQDNYDGTVPESITVNISCGKGWVDDEDGATVEHKDGLEKFKGSSLYGKMIALVAGKKSDMGDNAVIGDGGEPVEFDYGPLSDYMAEQGFDDPRVAAIWEGVTFEFRGIGFKYRGDTQEPYIMAIPARVVEVPGAKPKGKAKSKAKAQPESEVVDEVPEDDSSGSDVDTTEIWSAAGADDELADNLNTLVSTSNSHAAFAKNAVMLPGVKDNEVLLSVVMDEANWPS